MRNLSKLLAALVLCAVSVGCSSGAYCERNSKCKNQPATDRSDGGACAAVLNRYPTCRKQHEDFLNCSLDHEAPR